MPRRGQGSVDGAWWPYSRNLEVELADLIDHFPADAGHVRRVLFSRPDWQSFPRRVAIGRGFIKTGSFPADDTHLLVLNLSTGAQLNVLVIPPETPPEAARAILLRAATASDKLSPSSLLATVTAPDAGERGITGGTASDEHPAHENEPAHPNMAYVSTDEDADYSQDEGGEG